jgi:hypothetical protein
MDADAVAAIERVAAAAQALQPSIATDRDLRSASVTIRMSKAECARLHRRAAEAGLTVSAYLRSCALEAESLRAEVKQTLAELKAASNGTSHPIGSKPPARATGSEPENKKQGNKKSGRRNFFSWIWQLIQHRH